MNLTITVSGTDTDTMSADQVMQKIADWQGWRITQHPDIGYCVYEVQDKKTGWVFTYDVVNDEIEYADGKTRSLFDFHNGGNDEAYASLDEFLQVPFAVWGTDEEDAWWLYHG